MRDERFGPLQVRHRWFTDTQKGMFYRLVLPPKRGTFLEIGAGSGIVSACLSEDYERGYALESRVSLVEFLELRFRLDSISNVQVLKSEDLDVPVADGSIDLVAVNEGVARVPTVSRFLSEMRRCLAPDGLLVVAGDNAWDFRRILRSLSGRSRSESRGRMLTCSYFGYRSLLQRAGFRNVQVFVVMPDRHMPIDIYSFHRPSLDHLFAKYYGKRGIKRAVWWLSSALRVPHFPALFESAFYVVARK